MSCVATDNATAREIRPCCIVGFGNVHRRDDGVGPWIIEQLSRRLDGVGSVRLISGHHLDPGIVDDLRDADLVIIIDASVRQLNSGWQWEVLEPRGDPPGSLHSYKPGFLLYLLERLYDDRPQAWLISIQGESFDYGEGLSQSVEQRADEVVSALDDFLSKEGKYDDRA